MKNIFLTLCSLSITFSSFAQSINWEWARCATGSPGQEGWAAASDQSGNVFVTGYFYTTPIIFDSIILPNNSNNNPNLFLVKYSPSGSVLWAKSPTIIGSPIISGFSVATDESGNVYVTGGFAGDSIQFGTSILSYPTNSGLYFFVAKYDSSGNPLWGRSAGGHGNTAGNGVATDKNGNVYVTGYFQGDTMRFGTTFLVDTSQVVNNSLIFIAKYDASGNVLWAKSAGGSAYDEGWAIATDASGNVYVTGRSSDATLNFDSIVLQTSNIGGANLFLVKYDSSGNALWAKSAGGNYNYAVGNSIATDGSGNVYFTGTHSGVIAFDSITLPINFNGNYFFITKCSPSGTVLWAKSAYIFGLGSLQGNSIAVDKGGSVYVSAGSLNPIDSITLDGTKLRFPTGTKDPTILIRYDLNGNLLCLDALASGGDDRNAICVDALGNAYIAGDFEINSFIFGSDTLTNIGSEAIFVAKFSCGTITTSENITESAVLEIFPNPVSTQATIKYSVALGSKNVEVIVYNLLGEQREIYKLPANGNQVDINFNNMGGGIYFCSLITDEKIIVTRKLVVD